MCTNQNLEESNVLTVVGMLASTDCQSNLLKPHTHMIMIMKQRVAECFFVFLLLFHCEFNIDEEYVRFASNFSRPFISINVNEMAITQKIHHSYCALLTTCCICKYIQNSNKHIQVHYCTTSYLFQNMSCIFTAENERTKGSLFFI